MDASKVETAEKALCVQWRLVCWIYTPQGKICPSLEPRVVSATREGHTHMTFLSNSLQANEKTNSGKTVQLGLWGKLENLPLMENPGGLASG